MYYYRCSNEHIHFLKTLLLCQNVMQKVILKIDTKHQISNLNKRLNHFTTLRAMKDLHRILQLRFSILSVTLIGENRQTG